MPHAYRAWMDTRNGNMADPVWSNIPASRKQGDTLEVEKTVSPISSSGRSTLTSKMSPPKDSYWFAHAAEPKEKPQSASKITSADKEKEDQSILQDQLSPSHKPSTEKHADLHLEGVSPVEKSHAPPRAATPNRLDSYWFAHGGIDLSSPSGDQASDSGFSDGKENSPPTLQKDKKERHHKQYYDDRPTEKEDKETISSQNLEQEAKLEARRNAQRNSLSFAFGNSSKSLDNNIVISNGQRSTYQGSEVLFPIIQHVDEHDILDGKKQDTSSYNLIQKIGFCPDTTRIEIPNNENTYKKRKYMSYASSQTKACLTWSDNASLPLPSKGIDNDCMSRSMLISSTAGRRRKTDLTPVVPWNRTTVSRTISPVVRKEVSHSPVRPRSSLAPTAEGTTGQTQTLPKVTMRPKTKSRPRPISIAGTVPDHTSKTTSTPLAKEQHRPSRAVEKKEHGTKPPTAKPPSGQKVPATIIAAEEIEVDKKSDRSVSPLPKSASPQPRQVSPQPITETTTQPCVQTELEENEEDMTTSITKTRSEDEAKAALQEKRRLAREQAEREAELERQRQEEIRQQEEERRRKEEEEQRKQEEEQLRLMEELRQQEEAKLKKAIEEREQREAEEMLKQEEEERLKAEKEEQERKAREEAERQRKELEERLRREEAERAERKKRVEQIMSRTRGKQSSQQSETSDKPLGNLPNETPLKLASLEQLPSNVISVISSIHRTDLSKEKSDDVPNNNTVTIANDEHKENIKEIDDSNKQTKLKENIETHGDSTINIDVTRPHIENFNNVTTDLKQTQSIVINNIKDSDQNDSCDKFEHLGNNSSPQTNGYSSSEEKDTNKSLSKSESSATCKNLVKMQSSPDEQITESSLEQVIHLEEVKETTTDSLTINQNDNLLNNADDVNSNRVPGNPLIAFEETSVTG